MRGTVYRWRIIINRIMPDDIDSEFFAKRKQVEDGYLRQIEAKFGDRILHRIPLMEYDISGYESIDRGQDFQLGGGYMEGAIKKAQKN